jgi:hypothetical protein
MTITDTRSLVHAWRKRLPNCNQRRDAKGLGTPPARSAAPQAGSATKDHPNPVRPSRSLRLCVYPFAPLLALRPYGKGDDL